MIDRMVCADGGNSDPTSTHGKDASKAKALELSDWPYSRHLEGRLFSLVVHGDTEGVENHRRSLTDWLASMALEPADAKALQRYIGYWRPYATSHYDLDEDAALQQEVVNARVLARAVMVKRRGEWPNTGAGLRDPRSK